jgi:hypothetical protein
VVNLLNINVIILIILNLVLGGAISRCISYPEQVQDKKDIAAIGAKSEDEQHAFTQNHKFISTQILVWKNGESYEDLFDKVVLKNAVVLTTRRYEVRIASIL